MFWSLFATFFVGAICALRLPIFHFTVFLVVGILIAVLIFIVGGASEFGIIRSVIIYAVALELGYVFANYSLYLIYTKIVGRGLKNHRKDDSGPLMFKESKSD